ncbi:acetate kinase [Desulfovibrio sp. OttesenSCG-928-A18]|nr:acetate kinase [Desulfovibrio sp. OttesenSCG-928-A18]
MNILVINCGSSSFKYQLIEMGGQTVLCSGLVQRIGDSMGSLTHKKAPGGEGEKKYTEERPFPDHTAGMTRVMSLLTDPELGVIGSLSEIAACGHRVVQGGEIFKQSCIVGEKELEQIAALSPLAPLHNPAHVQGLEVVMRLLPHAPSVAVFDTEFHSTMPQHAFMYALPYEIYEQQRVRRYGMHGTSHRYVAQQAARVMSRQEPGFNVITCHLGNGCSVSAVKDGKCVDTSMGMTPLAGVVMGTRCGDIDPAIHAYLGRQTGMGLEDIDSLLNRKSGMKGICGMNDMRDIHAARKKGDARAQLAFDMFCHSIRKYIGAYYAVLGRVDAIVFTAGIGENDPESRAAICKDLEAMGIVIDPAKNEKRFDNARSISPVGVKVRVLVVPTNEEIVIAGATAALLKEKMA